jgi:hypothetical protein
MIKLSEVYCDTKFHDPAGSIAYVTPDSEFRRTATLVLSLKRYLWLIKTQTYRNCNQYTETEVMNILLNLLRIKGLYIFRALLAHPQEALNKRHLVYYMSVMSVGCTTIGAELHSWRKQLTTRTQYTKCCLWSASCGWASNARNM